MKIFTTAAAIATALATTTLATAAPAPGEALHLFGACVEKAGFTSELRPIGAEFKKNTDIRVLLKERVIAGIKVLDGFTVQPSNAILAQPQLHQMLDTCLKEAGMPVPGD
jgi:hypothetical protein